MYKFGERLKIARKARGFRSSTHLSEALGVAANSVSRWETGAREPNLITIKRISEVLNVSIAYLMGEENADFVNEAVVYTGDLIELTLYDIPAVVSCEMKLASLQSSKGVGTIFTKIDSFTVYDKKRPPFAVTMPNDSMRGAGANKGDVIAINPVEHPENGELAFVIYNGTGLIRWVVRKADGLIELQAANPDYASIFIEQQYVNNAFVFRVVGRVVEIITRKKPTHAF